MYRSLNDREIRFYKKIHLYTGYTLAEKKEILNSVNDRYYYLSDVLDKLPELKGNFWANIYNYIPKYSNVVKTIVRGYDTTGSPNRQYLSCICIVPYNVKETQVDVRCFPCFGKPKYKTERKYTFENQAYLYVQKNIQATIADIQKFQRNVIVSFPSTVHNELNSLNVRYIDARNYERILKNRDGVSIEKTDEMLIG